MDHYPLPADMEAGRCMWCDSRYCWDGCYAHVPGYLYVVGRGYLPAPAAIAAANEGCEVDGITRDAYMSDGTRRTYTPAELDALIAASTEVPA
jgi:hypothetical protein